MRLSYQEEVPVRSISGGKIVIWNAIFAHAQRLLVQPRNIVVVMEHVNRIVLLHHARKQNADAIKDGRELSVKNQVAFTILISLNLLKEAVYSSVFSSFYI